MQANVGDRCKIRQLCALSALESPLRPTSRLLVTNRLSLSHATVAVGTTITDRPPHRSVRARLRIRLLPKMNGVEALVGIGMQDMGVWNPPAEQWVETIPSHLRALTATD